MTLTLTELEEKLLALAAHVGFDFNRPEPTSFVVNAAGEPTTEDDGSTAENPRPSGSYGTPKPS